MMKSQNSKVDLTVAGVYGKPHHANVPLDRKISKSGGRSPQKNVIRQLEVETSFKYENVMEALKSVTRGTNVTRSQSPESGTLTTSSDVETTDLESSNCSLEDSTPTIESVLLNFGPRRTQMNDLINVTPFKFAVKAKRTGKFLERLRSFIPSHVPMVQDIDLPLYANSLENAFLIHSYLYWTLLEIPVMSMPKRLQEDFLKFYLRESQVAYFPVRYTDKPSDKDYLWNCIDGVWCGNNIKVLRSYKQNNDILYAEIHKYDYLNKSDIAGALDEVGHSSQKESSWLRTPIENFHFYCYLLDKYADPYSFYHALRLDKSNFRYPPKHYDLHARHMKPNSTDALSNYRLRLNKFRHSFKDGYQISDSISLLVNHPDQLVANSIYVKNLTLRLMGYYLSEHNLKMYKTWRNFVHFQQIYASQDDQFDAERVRLNFPFRCLRKAVYCAFVRGNKPLAPIVQPQMGLTDSIRSSLVGSLPECVRTGSLPVSLTSETAEIVNRGIDVLNSFSKFHGTDDFMQSLSNMLQGTVPFTFITKIVVVVGNIINFFKTRSTTIKASCITQVSFIIGESCPIIYNHVASVFAYLSKTLWPVQPQSSGIDYDFHSSVLYIMYKFLASMFGFSPLEDGVLRKAAQALKSFDVGLHSLSGIVTYFLNVAQFIFDWVGVKIDLPWNLSAPVMAVMRDIRHWSAEATEYLQMDLHPSKIYASLDLQARLTACKRSADDIIHRVTGCFIPNVHMTGFYAIYNQIKNIAEIVLHLKPNEHMRSEPKTVWLTGPPGTGKSHCLVALMGFIDTQDGVMPSHLHRFERKAGTQFWEGYHQQKFVTIDDVFQGDTVAVNSVAALELIYMVNVNTYCLDMAALESKGANFFTSEYVFLTSNTNVVPVTAALADEKALKRRFMNKFEVTLINPELNMDESTFEECVQNWIFISDKKEKLNFWELAAKVYENKKNCFNNFYDSMISWAAKRLGPVVQPQFSLSEFMEKHKPTLPECNKPSILKFATILSGLSALAIGMYSLFKKKPKKERPYRSSIHNRFYIESGDPQTSHLANTNVRLESSSNPNHLDLMRNVVPRSTCTFTNSRGNSVHGVFIFRRTLATVYHIIFDAKSEDPITLRMYNNTEYKFLFRELTVSRVPNQDLVFITFPKGLPCQPDISKHFVEKNDYTSNLMNQSYLLTCDSNSVFMQDVGIGHIVGGLRYDQDLCLTKTNIEFSGQTSVGDCGAIYCSMVKNKPLIFAMHSASALATDAIYGQPICRDYFAEYINDKSPDQLTISTEVVEAQFSRKKTLIECPEGMEHIGGMRPSERHYISTRTKLRHSLLFDLISKHTTLPAVLSPVNGQSPLQLGINKMSVPTKYIDFRLIDLASQYLLPSIGLPDKTKRRVLTVSEAVNGIMDWSYTTGMELKTSPGYPYTQEKSKAQKKSWFDFIDETYVPNSILQARISSRELHYKSNVCPVTIWQDNLKDERRPIAKVLALKTRTFVCPPMDYSIISRQYLQAFNDHVMCKRLQFDCTVGINPHSREWGMLYARLRGVCSEEPFWIAGDFSAYDSSIPARVGWKVCSLINSWYKDNNDCVRNCIFTDAINSVHCGHDVVYRVDKGNPSGMPATSIFNSICNSILLRCCWVIMIQTGELQLTISDFDKYVRVAVFGDDNVLAINPVCSFFNMNTIRTAMSYIGLIFTESSKIDNKRDFIPFSEITFLKRSFRLDTPYVYAPLDEGVIMEMMNWVRDTGPIDVATYVNCQTAVREFFHYGPQIFQQKKELINTHLSLISLPPVQLEYQTLYSEFHGQGLDMRPGSVRDDVKLFKMNDDFSLGCFEVAGSEL